MRRSNWLIFWGLLMASGCVVEVDEPSLGDASAETEVGLVDSALSSTCTLQARRGTRDGFVESMQCSGLACTRTCGGIAGSLLCSTRCEVDARTPAQVPLDLSVLRPECRVDPNSRIEGGWPAITQALCEARGSCWDNRTRDPKFPWCYEALGRQPTCGGVEAVANPGARVNAGDRSSTVESCVRSGACWDSRIRNVNWCYVPMASTQDLAPGPATPGAPPISPGTGPCGVSISPNPLVLNSGPIPGGYRFDQGIQTASVNSNCQIVVSGLSAQKPLELFTTSPSVGRAGVLARDNVHLDPQSPCFDRLRSGQRCSVDGAVTYNLLPSGASVQGFITLNITP